MDCIYPNESWVPLLRRYPQSPKINAVSLEAEAMYLRLLACCDDGANYFGDPDLLLSRLFSLRNANDEIDIEDVQYWRDELVQAGLVVLYSAGPDNAEYIHIVNCRRFTRKYGGPVMRFPAYEESFASRATENAQETSKTPSRPEPARTAAPSHSVSENNSPLPVTNAHYATSSTSVPVTTARVTPRLPHDRSQPAAVSAASKDIEALYIYIIIYILYLHQDPCYVSSEKQHKKNTPGNFFCTERNSSVPCSSTIEYDFSQRKFLNITDIDIAGWTRAYPAVDIKIELLQAGEWLYANPRRRKKNIRRFINTWMNHRQERGGTRGYNPPLRISCRICGAAATKHIDGKGSYCPRHSPDDEVRREP